MANITITTNDLGYVQLREGRYRDETLLFSAADTWVAGTILARKLVSDTITVGYTRADDSDYTAVASASAGKTLQIGAYTVTAGTLTTGVGTWTAVAPDGDTDTFTSSAADDDMVFPELGLTLTITAVSSVFDTGDIITVTPAAQSGTPLVAYAIAGTNGAQTPVAILPYDVTVTSGGSVAARVATAGYFNFARLVVDADGDNSNITLAIRDLLCAQGLVDESVTQLSVLDNGAS